MSLASLDGVFRPALLSYVLKRSSDKAIPEKDLQKNIIELAELCGWRVYHVANVRRQLRSKTGVGYLDLTLARQDRVLFAELKSDKGVVSSEQQEWIEMLKASGQEVYVWRPEHWLSGEIEKVLKRTGVITSFHYIME